jgi:TPR repeat protein
MFFTSSSKMEASRPILLDPSQRANQLRFFPQDYIEVESESAEQGQAEAQYGLAWAYRRGELVPQDYPKAVKWYRIAAEQGHIDAQYELGVMHRCGEGVAQDHAEAAKWYRKAAEQGHPDAQSCLGAVYAPGEGVAG